MTNGTDPILRAGQTLLLPLDPEWLPLDAIPLAGPWEALWRTLSGHRVTLRAGNRKLAIEECEPGLLSAGGLAAAVGEGLRWLMVKVASLGDPVELEVHAPAGSPSQIPMLGPVDQERLPLLDAGADRLHRLALELGRSPALSQLVCDGLVSGFAPFDYQRRVARTVLTAMRGQAILADEVGLGKTIEAGLVLLEYMARGLVKRALVLTPPSLVSQWADELRSRFNIQAQTPDSADGAADGAKGKAGRGARSVTVMSIHTAKRDSHREALQGTPWDMVIVDEAHHVASERTQGYKLVATLKKKFILLLTATPIQNDLRELYNLVTLLRPGEMGTWGTFKRRYVGAEGVKDAAGLRGLLKGTMVRNRRSDCGLVLPPRHARTLRIEPTASERRLYEDASRWVRERAGTEGPGSSMALKAIQRAAGSSTFALAAALDRSQDSRAQGLARQARELTGDSKARALVETVRETGEPMVVFTQFVATHEGLSQLLEREGIKVHRFCGATTRRQRDAAVDAFREQGGVLVATEAGAEGRNLQFAHHLVNFDVPWNPMRIEQRLGRVHRIGQEHPVQVYTFVSAGTLEADLVHVLEEKVALFELVLGELDVILGQVEERGPLEDEVFRTCIESETEDVRRRGLEAIGELLRLAKEDYLRRRELTDAVTGGELATRD